MKLIYLNGNKCSDSEIVLSFNKLEFIVRKISLNRINIKSVNLYFFVSIRLTKGMLGR